MANASTVAVTAGRLWSVWGHTRGVRSWHGYVGARSAEAAVALVEAWYEDAGGTWVDSFRAERPKPVRSISEDGFVLVPLTTGEGVQLPAV